MTALVLRGDARALPLPDASVDCIVTDPPYGLEFMGREWDSFKPAAARFRARLDGRTNPTEGRSSTSTPEAYVAQFPFQVWCQEWAAEALRVLKPGGQLLAFGGTRTYHRLACAIEDAGFEIRDSVGVLGWVYAEGFPKSLNAGRAIDAALCPAEDHGARGHICALNVHGDPWRGHGTALKPAWEPIVVARKPLARTVAGNVLAYGTGALNVDACRVPAGQDYEAKCASVVGLASNRNGHAYGEWTGVRADSFSAAGRWPPNLLIVHHPDCADRCVPNCHATELDAQSGTSTSRPGPPRSGAAGAGWRTTSTGAEYADTGGASRFYPQFRFNAKAGTWERPTLTRPDGTVLAHPTVKPVDLMRWLVRLVAPPGGLVLDPFAGSGATLQAAHLEGFRAIGVELDAEHCALVRERLSWPVRIGQGGDFERLRPAVLPAGQMDLLALGDPA